MSDPDSRSASDPRYANDPQLPAEAAPAAPPHPGPQGTAAERFTNPDAALGGADAVQKTSYGVGHGTDPASATRAVPAAHPAAGSGPNYLAWGVGAIALLVAFAYLVSVIR